MSCKSIIQGFVGEFSLPSENISRFPHILFIFFCTGFVDSADKPNILWLVAEDMSPRIGIYGDEYATTPTLDKLGKAGAIYTRAFTVSPVCSAVRTSLITGMYTTTTRSHDHRSNVPRPAYAKNFPEYLQEVGYWCINPGKTDYNFTDESQKAGWDDGNHWRDAPEGKPWFAVFNSETTHESKHFNADQQTTERDLVKAALHPRWPDNQRVRHTVAKQYDYVTNFDNWVKGRLKQLEDDGLADNTIVFVYGDHGSGLPLYKRWIWDSGVHIPLIIRWPGKIEPGTVNQELVSSIDFAPTLISLAGAEIPDYMPGRVFVGAGKQPEPEYLFYTRDRMDETIDRMRGVRNKRFKYIKNYIPGVSYSQVNKYGEKSPIMQEMRTGFSEGTLNDVQLMWFAETKPVEELYDLNEDPFEINNLAGNSTFNDTLEKFRGIHEEWLVNTDDFLLQPKSQWVDAHKPENAPASQTPIFSESPTITKAELNPATGMITIALTPPTEGASVSYATGEGDTAEWKTYDGEFEALKGSVLWARTGWGASEILKEEVAETSVVGILADNNNPEAAFYSLFKKAGDRYNLKTGKSKSISSLKISRLNGTEVFNIQTNVSFLGNGFEVSPGYYVVSGQVDLKKINFTLFLL